MKSIELKISEYRTLISLAAFGALIPNGVFCYYFVTSPETTKVALTNPISLVFIMEAFILMFLFAWLLGRTSSDRPTWKAFIVMSLLGSMVFSVPATLYLLLKRRNERA